MSSSTILRPHCRRCSRAKITRPASEPSTKLFKPDRPRLSRPFAIRPPPGVSSFCARSAACLRPHSAKFWPTGACVGREPRMTRPRFSRMVVGSSHGNANDAALQAAAELAEFFQIELLGTVITDANLHALAACRVASCVSSNENGNRSRGRRFPENSNTPLSLHGRTSPKASVAAPSRPASTPSRRCRTCHP